MTLYLDAETSREAVETLRLKQPPERLRREFSNAAKLAQLLSRTLARLQHVDASTSEAPGVLPAEPRLEIVDSTEGRVEWLVRVRDSVRYHGTAQIEPGDEGVQLRVVLLYDPVRHVVKRWLEDAQHEDVPTTLRRDLEVWKQRLDSEATRAAS